MNSLVFMLLTICLIAATIMTALSHHWLLAWACLELNMLSIIPLMMRAPHPRATEATVKYFITQTLASSLVILAGTLNAWQTGQWAIINMTPAAATMLTVGLLTKLGAAPMHMWYMEVLQGMTMNMALLISTWQKLAPLALLTTTANHLPHNTTMTIGLTSVVLGGLLGLNQTQTRKILACSSISHMGWIIMTLPINPQLTTVALLIYIIISTMTFNLLAATKTTSLLDLGNAWTTSPALLSLMTCALMSLGSVPPLSGFMPKILILNDMARLNLLPFATVMALASLPNLYFYTRMAYLTMLTTPPHTNQTKYTWRTKLSPQPILATLGVLSLLLLPLTPSLYNTL
uniref:NADH-ubiquinone oxidoreductase chain 2 n=1 Tax=Uroplatus ebenaui TaxID=357318 RepID=A0A0A1H9X1_9SAUR|nr:NADH dehydrogenase subunit 2 [Uroplatus ebenaui]BAP90310.1 NADH dehydrogenase subunit 2 [Uroplatus ebenaui]